MDMPNTITEKSCKIFPLPYASTIVHKNNFADNTRIMTYKQTSFAVKNKHKTKIKIQILQA